MSGKFIVIDGVDMGGKSTVVKLLKNYLKNKDINSIVCKNPGSTDPIGTWVRKIVKDPSININNITRAMLFALDNQCFQETHAKPLANTDIWVIADRNNFISALAYQAADGIALSEIQQIHSSLINPRKIDHVFVLDISWETRQQRHAFRMTKEGIVDDYYERDYEHFNKLRNAYLRLQDHKDILHPYIEHDDDYIMNIHIINGNVPGEEILQQIIDILKVN